MDLIKYDMTNIWAVAGDVVAPDGAKIRSGWGVEVVPRQWWNWFENRQDNNIAYMLQKGIPEWDSTTEYIVGKSYVQRSGIVYRATVTNTNSDPIALTSWVKAFLESTNYLEKIKNVPIVNSSVPAIDSNGAAAYALFGPIGLQSLNASTQAGGRSAIDAQQANVSLTALSGVTPAVNGLPYFTSTTAMGIANLTAFGRALISGNDAAAVRIALGLGNSSTRDVGTAANTVAAGNDSRIINALQSLNNLSDLANLATARSNLGLTSAATTALTTSQFDTTIGRILKVGDFGLGNTSNVAATDLNSLAATGVYGLTNATTNSPPNSGAGSVVLHQSWDSNTQYQIVSAGNRMWTRWKTGTWQAWQEFYTTANTSGLVSQVQTNIQPQLDAKVSRSGDTMSGPLFLPSLGLGLGAASGYIDLHAQNSSTSYDARLSVDSGTTSLGGGRMVLQAANVFSSGAFTVSGVASFQSGISSTALSLSTALPVSSGGTGSSNPATALVNLGALPAVGGTSYTPGLGGLKVSGTYVQGQAGQGMTISWNDGLNGAAVLTNNQGGGTGGFLFRNVNGGNTAETGRVTILQNGSLTSSGALTAATSVGAGAAFMDTSGNINGSVWGGYLTSYLASNYIAPSNLGANIAAMGAGVIGTYAFLVNTSGTSVSAGQSLSSGLSYASTTSNGGGTAGGTWRAMGFGTTNGTTVWLRIA